MIVRICIFLLAVGALLNFNIQKKSFERKDRLSEYNFFKGQLSALEPAETVIPYDVNTALFSNYAEKTRFLIVPGGEKIAYNDSSTLEFPQGSILIKNFFYPLDFRQPAKGRRILETRLLVHESTGWKAYPYIWNDEQTDAVYDPAGETKTVSYVNMEGKTLTSQYHVPNKNQCKGCHIRAEKMQPIGVSARQLNRDHQYPEGNINQLQYLFNKGLLDSLPEQLPRLAVWNDPASGSLNERARAYLDANCGHCHSPLGPANTSGLFLNIGEKDKGHLGILKSPVAAGRGAGALQFDIVPGEPQNSILLFRMKTNDPAIAMPEIGREQIHEEAVALIHEWIKKNNF